MFDFVALDGLAGKVAQFIARADKSIAKLDAQQTEILERLRALTPQIPPHEEVENGR